MRTILRNQMNEIIGYLDDDGVVRDKHCEMVGRIIAGQTRDKHGQLVSHNEVPGLLLGGN